MAKRRTDAAAGKCVLHVHAEGAQNIHASDSRFSLDAKPDPYVVFVLDDVTHKCDHVNDVEPIKYFTWPNAVKGFEIVQERTLTDSSLIVHVKDSDTIKDRYIGGTAIPLGPLYAAMQNNVLCQSKMFTLEFADEKFKKKKDSGEVKLTITLIEEQKPQALAAPTPSTSTASVAEPQAQPPARVAIPAETVPAEQAAATQAKEMAKSDNPVELEAAPDLKPENELVAVTESSSTPQTVYTPSLVESTSPAISEKVKRQSSSGKSIVEPLQRQPTKSALGPIKTAAAIQEVPASISAAAPVAAETTASNLPPAVIKAMTVELVSARNLVRPVSLGGIFDRKPDPFVALEFCGITKTSAVLKDVDLKKPIEWKQTMLEFELPLAVVTSFPRKGVSPMDLVIHVKDENLMKPTYMGGTKMSVAEFFQRRGAAGEWIGSPAAVNRVERTYPLIYGDEKLSKRKQCGEITVRFHFTVADPPPPVTSETAAESVGIGEVNAETSLVPSNLASVPVTEKSIHQAVLEEVIQSVPSDPVPISAPLSKDVKLLSIEALCGRKLLRPSPGANPKGLMKSLFDRKPDPYVIFVLNGQQKKCPALKDVDVAFFEWHQAVQVFEITQKPYPKELIIHIRDEDTIGKDPYMAGARIPLEKIWEGTLQNTCGDAELVKEYPLTFIDESLTKQKPCGEITLRFRWVYAEVPLPVAEEVPAPVETKEPPEELSNAKPQQLAAVVKSHIGHVVLRNLVLWDKDSLIDSTLDLYIVASYFPPRVGQSAKGRVSASTSVLTDATKKKGSTSSEVKVEWKEEELVLPAIAYDDEREDNFMIELKDKNSITKDAQIADLLLPIQSIIASDGCLVVERTLELQLCGAKKSKSKTTTDRPSVQLSFKIQFVPLGSPLLGNALSSGIVLTVFLVKGLLKFGTEAEMQKHVQDSIGYGLNIDYLSNQKKNGFLTFGKHDVEAQTDKFQPQIDLTIEWRTCLDVVYSSKQIAAVEDKDSLEVELQLLQIAGNKSSKSIGSTQLNLWALLNSTTSTSKQLTTTTIRFSESALMDLEFAVAYRAAKEDRPSESTTSVKGGEVSAFKSAVHVPNGNLHLLVVKAQGLVPPNPSEEKTEDLDPEVRISIEPKYIKRKDNPVRSMLKTRPLENAGLNPAWTEYLRLEYRLPPPPTAPTDVPVGKSIEDSSAYAQSIQMLPPPIIQIGIYDIEIPGERNGSKIIGKAEVPLNAFMLSKIDPSLDAQNAVSLKIDIHLQDKVTGSLYVEGVFEPLDVDKGAETEKQQEMVQSLCRSIGKNLSIRAKNARSNPDASGLEIARQVLLPGRLEIHFVCIRYGDRATADGRALTAHVWLNSSMEDRKELKSKLENPNCSVEGIEESDVIWDRQTTLYAKDISSELLRVEVLTMTGKPVGSIKLPLSGIQSYGSGQMVRDWHPLVPPAVVTKPSLFSKAAPPPALKALIGVAFYPDQALFQPLRHSGSVIDDTHDSVVVLRCGKLVFGEETQGGVQEGTAAGSTTIKVNALDEVACKFVLIGGAATSGSASSTFQKQVAARNSVVEWNEVLPLELGASPRKFVQRSLVIGACPILRVEIVIKRKNGRFPEQLTSYELSLVGVLSNAENGKVSRLCALYNVDEKGVSSFIGVLQIEMMVVPAAVFRNQQPGLILSAGEGVRVVPGVLCLRFIAGRNLTDVDPNGEQDPYVVTKVAPYFPPSGALISACQTSVSMNGGCHPQWNSPVYHLQVRDLRTDFLRIDVIDSNEEDNLADALIGSLGVAAASLFPHEVASRSRQKGKTKWFETWLPIYPIGNEGSEDISGEIRVDYRFISQEYYSHADNFEESARGMSPFRLAAQEEEPPVPGAGKIYFHIVRAKNIPCTKGMQPGVRVVCKDTGFSQVSKPAMGSIQNPQWEGEVMEMEWPEHTDLSSRPSTVVSIEIVDLSVRTANASAMAVITFGFVNFESFLSHPTATSYVFHELGGSRDKGERCCILLGCQYIPKDREKDVQPLQRKQREDLKETEGQLHLKVLGSRFDMPCFFSRMVMNRIQILRFRLLNGAQGGTNQVEVHDEQLTFPDASTKALVESDGSIDWQAEGSQPKESPIPMYSLLFNCATSSEVAGSELICVNPMLICEVILREGDQAAAAEEVLGELEIPIFDFILLDGHLASSWYPLSLPAGQLDALKQTGSFKTGAAQLGEVKLELQYLPSQAKTKEPKPAQLTDVTTVISIQVREARNLPISSHQVCIVSVDMLGVSLETMPTPVRLATSSQESGNTLQWVVWNEELEFPFSAEKLRNAKDFAVRIQIRDALRENEVIASCNWVLPVGVTESGEEAIQPQNQQLGEEVTLKLQLTKDENQLSKNPSDKNPTSEIRFFIQRVSMKEISQTDPLSAQLVLRNSCADRVGLLYFRLDSPTQNVFLAGSLMASTSELGELAVSYQEYPKSKQSSTALLTLPQIEWIEVDGRGDLTSVFPVNSTCSIDKQKLVIFLSQSPASDAKTTAAVIGYVQVDARSLASAVKSPKTEFYQQIAVQPLSPTSKLSIKDLSIGSQLPLRFKFVKICQGEIVLNVLRLESLPSTSKTSTSKAAPSFRVEVRYQQSKAQWTKSSLGFFNRKSNEIEWKESQKPIKLLYSNEFEVSEPILQIVVYHFDSASTGGESGIREAYGQLSLLGLLTDPKGETGGCYQVQVPLSTTDLSAANRPMLHLELSFIGDELSFDEKQAIEAKARRETAFLLAEGTAELKRSFAFMGGNEDTPLKISALKEHLLAESSSGAAMKAREVLQYAANMETDGDLDRLFAAMDVNGDGMLSWDEYADHMQNMHALAQANATKSREESEDIKDPEEVDNDAEREEKPLSKEVINDDHEEDDLPQIYHNISSFSNSARPLDKQLIAELTEVDEYKLPTPVKHVSQRMDVAKSETESPETIKKPNKDAKPTAQDATMPARKTPEVSVPSSKPPEVQHSKQTEKTVNPQKVIVSEPKERNPQEQEPPASQVAHKKQYPALNSYVLDWKVEDVMLWLTSEMELSQYCEAFQKNAVNGKLLLTLSEEELESEIGVVATLHKRKLMNQIREFQDKFGSPPPPVVQQQLGSPERKKTRKPQSFETTMLGETPNFIKREQLLYQEKQKAVQDLNPKALKIGGGLESVKVLRATTRLVQSSTQQQPALPLNPAPGLQGESYNDAMQDVMESVRPNSPPPEEDTPPDNFTTDADPQAPIAFPAIQIGSVTNTDELFEIVKQRIQQLSRVLQPLSKVQHETFSDFGDDDDQNEPPEEQDEGKTGLHLVFHAFTTKSRSPKISRAKFQEGMASLLFIDVSWHQFDLLFRRLDVDYDGELSFDEFCDVFQREHLTFQRADLLFLEDALVNFVIEKLETQQWTLIELFKAFDRDGGGEISIAEFATLVRFLFTKKDKRRLKSEEKEDQKRSKRLVYLLMSCLDASADRRINLQEFLRFFFVVWSSRLMEVQDQLYDCESRTADNKATGVIESLRLKKKTMRKALRTNFSRPFRDSMRCVDVSMPSPFNGLLSRLELLTSHSDESSTTSQSSNQQQQPLQIWQVLQGQTSTSHRDPMSMSALYAETKAKATEDSRKRVQKGKNEVLRTRLTRQREPERTNAVLQTPASHVDLDRAAKLKYDHKGTSSR